MFLNSEYKIGYYHEHGQYASIRKARRASCPIGHVIQSPHEECPTTMSKAENKVLSLPEHLNARQPRFIAK